MITFAVILGAATFWIAAIALGWIAAFFAKETAAPTVRIGALGTFTLGERTAAVTTPELAIAAFTTLAAFAGGKAATGTDRTSRFVRRGMGLTLKAADVTAFAVTLGAAIFLIAAIALG